MCWTNKQTNKRQNMVKTLSLAAFWISVGQISGPNRRQITYLLLFQPSVYLEKSKGKKKKRKILLLLVLLQYHCNVKKNTLTQCEMSYTQKHLDFLSTEMTFCIVVTQECTSTPCCCNTYSYWTVVYAWKKAYLDEAWKQISCILLCKLKSYRHGMEVCGWECVMRWQRRRHGQSIIEAKSSWSRSILRLCWLHLQSNFCFATHFRWEILEMLKCRVITWQYRRADDCTCSSRFFKV